jgi:hypothetical protein
LSLLLFVVVVVVVVVAGCLLVYKPDKTESRANGEGDWRMTWQGRLLGEEAPELARRDSPASHWPSRRHALPTPAGASGAAAARASASHSLTTTTAVASPYRKNKKNKFMNMKIEGGV